MASEPHLLLTVVSVPVDSVEDEENRLDEMRTRLGTDYLVIPAGEDAA